MTALPQTITEASALLHTKKISAVELTKAYLNRIEQTEPHVHALISVTQDQALEQAAYADEQIASGNKGSLLGIPLIHKDNFLTKNIRTTAASHILANYIGQYDGTVVERLKRSGTVMLGKANLDAFAHGSSTENSDYGPSYNPWDISRVPGGSSGGSAAAVAAQQCLVATGSDTGGSIRLPAAFTNLVGIKPTYGRVSRYGVIAMGSSFDSIGCITRTVADCALVLEQMAGHDVHDATTSPVEVPHYADSLEKPLRGLTFGLAEEFFTDALDSRIASAIDTARQIYEELGVTFKRVHLPHTKYALAAYYILVPSEVSANLARFDGIRYGYSVPDAQTLVEAYEQSRAKGFGAEAKRRIMLGTYALSAGYYDAYYKRAQQARTLVRADYEAVFKEVDGLLAPVSPSLPFKVGAKTDDPLAMYLSDALTVPVNLAGIPSLGLPCGFIDGLPVGMQLIGPAFSEERLFNWGHQYQRHTDWHTQIAKVEEGTV